MCIFKCKHLKMLTSMGSYILNHQVTPLLKIMPPYWPLFVSYSGPKGIFIVLVVHLFMVDVDVNMFWF